MDWVKYLDNCRRDEMRRTTAGVRDAVIYRELMDRVGSATAFVWYLTHQMDDARGLVPIYKPQLTIGGKSVPCERITQIKEKGFSGVDLAAGVSYGSMLAGVIDIGLEYDNLPKFVQHEWGSGKDLLEPFKVSQEQFDAVKMGPVPEPDTSDLCSICNGPLGDGFLDLLDCLDEQWCKTCWDRVIEEEMLSRETWMKERELRDMQTHLTIATGKKTYQARESLKSAGFLWNPETKRWEKCPPMDEGDRRMFVNVLRRLDVADGVTVETIRKPQDGEDDGYDS